MQSKAEGQTPTAWVTQRLPLLLRFETPFRLADDVLTLPVGGIVPVADFIGQPPAADAVTIGGELAHADAGGRGAGHGTPPRSIRSPCSLVNSTHSSRPAYCVRYCRAAATDATSSSCAWRGASASAQVRVRGR